MRVLAESSDGTILCCATDTQLKFLSSTFVELYSTGVPGQITAGCFHCLNSKIFLKMRHGDGTGTIIFDLKSKLYRTPDEYDIPVPPEPWLPPSNLLTDLAILNQTLTLPQSMMPAASPMGGEAMGRERAATPPRPHGAVATMPPMQFGNVQPMYRMTGGRNLEPWQLGNNHPTAASRPPMRSQPSTTPPAAVSASVNRRQQDSSPTPIRSSQTEIRSSQTESAKRQRVEQSPAQDPQNVAIIPSTVETRHDFDCKSDGSRDEPAVANTAISQEKSPGDHEESKSRNLPNRIPATPIGFQPHEGAVIAYTRRASKSQGNDSEHIKFVYEWRSYHALFEWQKDDAEAVLANVHLPDNRHETIARVADAFRDHCTNQMGDQRIWESIVSLCDEVLTVMPSDSHLDTSVPTLNVVGRFKSNTLDTLAFNDAPH